MNQEETLTLNSIILEFENENPQIKIAAQSVPFDQAQNKFKTVAQAGQAPDIFRSEIAWTTEEAALGYLAPLDNLISEEVLKDYLTSPLNYNYYQGKLWGLPQVTDCLALLYNKRLFKEFNLKIPKNLKEFTDIAQKLTLDEKKRNANDPHFNPDKVMQYGFYFPGKAYWYQVFMWAFGGGLIDPLKQKILINNQGSLRALNFLLSLKRKYKCVPQEMDIQNAYDNMMAGFKEGKYAMIFNGPWSTSDILQGKEFKDSRNLGVAIIPKGEGGYGSPIGGHNYVISRNCKNIESAYKFISFLNSPENQIKFALKNNLLPTRLSSYKLLEKYKNPILLGFKAQLDVAKNRPIVPQASLIYIEFEPNIQAALLEDKTPQEALNDIAWNWKKLMGW